MEERLSCSSQFLSHLPDESSRRCTCIRSKRRRTRGPQVCAARSTASPARRLRVPAASAPARAPLRLRAPLPLPITDAAARATQRMPDQEAPVRAGGTEKTNQRKGLNSFQEGVENSLES